MQTPKDALRRIAASGKLGAVGMSWFEPSNYETLRNMMTDGHIFPATYDAWLKKARHQEQELLADGINVVRVILKPQEFSAWCALRGMNIDAKARTAFATEKASRNMRSH